MSEAGKIKRYFSVGRVYKTLRWFGAAIGIGDEGRFDKCLLIGLWNLTLIIGPHMIAQKDGDV